MLIRLGAEFVIVSVEKFKINENFMSVTYPKRHCYFAETIILSEGEYQFIIPPIADSNNKHHLQWEYGEEGGVIELDGLEVSIPPGSTCERLQEMCNSYRSAKNNAASYRKEFAEALFRAFISRLDLSQYMKHITSIRTQSEREGERKKVKQIKQALMV